MSIQTFPTPLDPIAPRLTPAVIATRYVTPGWFYGNISTATMPDGQFTYIPIFVSHTTTFIGIALHMSTASAATGTARLGIYTMNPVTRLPGTLVLDAGTVLTTTTGAKEIVISQALEANTWYYLCFVSTFTGATTPAARSIDETLSMSSPFTGESSTAGQVGGISMFYLTGRAADVAGGLPASAPAPTNGLLPGGCPILKLRIS